MLIYRFPGKEITQKNGSFELVHELPKDGFILSDFKGEKRYEFKEHVIDPNKSFEINEIPVIEKADYIKKGNLLKSTMKAIGIKKVVFSRIKELSFDETRSLDLFYDLEKAYPKAFVYLFRDEKLGTWIGASPEMLLRKIDYSGFTVSLAGTKRFDDSSDWSTKEKLEQAYVSDFIEEELKQLELKDIEKSEIYEHHAGPVKHLRTDFSFTIDNSHIDTYLNRIHPTPAVSGLPKSLAIEMIDQIENHDRGFYTGYIGEIHDENVSIFVNLRCCQIIKEKIYLYLGGGYTVDSDPDKEWEETENKSKTISDLIQKV
jgi:isochorismate synthase